MTVVTSAARSRAEELDARRRRYMITMTIRTVLFVLAVFLFRGVVRYVAIAGSLILPWIAVVFANAAPKRAATALPFDDLAPRRPAAVEAPREPVVIDAEAGGDTAG